MKKLHFLLVSIVLLITTTGFSQSDLIQAPITTGFGAVENPFFGGDNLVSNFHPIGPIAIIHKQNPSTIIIAVNDTLATSNLGIILYTSTNNGQNWNLYTNGLTIRHKIERMRLLRTVQDSVYLVFEFNNIVNIWNIYNMTIALHTSTDVRAFDIVTSSTGALYLYIDEIGNNNIRRYGSIDGGYSWVQTALMTSSGAFPTMCMSGTGDTVFINYYGTPFGSDTTTAKIRVARYIETAPGYLGSALFQDIATETVSKNEFITAAFGGIVWFFYTHGTTGSIDIKARGSTDGGTSYSPVFTMPSSPGVDEYWIDARYFTESPGGIDFSFYRDSLQSGTPTNMTDKLLSMYAYQNTPTSFSDPVQVSDHPPGWSSANYIPQIVEQLALTNYGFVWVGLDVPSSWRVYYDANNITTSLTNRGNSTPGTFKLYQNFPNPFNPVTKINFDVPKNGFVTLKVYNLLGKEVQTLVSRDLTSGSYTVDFNASKLTSGVYFYRLESNGYTDTKKMMLVK